MEEAMPIPSSDELLVQEEIKAAILEKALVELAAEFASRDYRGFEAALGRVVTMAQSHPVERFRPPERANASTFDIKRIQQEGFGLAIETLGGALNRVLKRFRPRG